MSNFAFGTYKVSDYNPQHIEAIKYALKSGISMVVTSSNYLDGSSEKAVALALNELDSALQENIEIVSKYKLSQNLHEQLKLSLERLQKDKIECYLIESPQELLIEAVKNNIPKDDRLDAMNAKFFDAFLELEEAVKEGKIDSYGISSDGYSLKHSSDYFLPYEDILVLAQDAADEVKNGKHSLTTIELPINMLELEGLKCASWAKENSLRVLANRPLNAQFETSMFRLAEYDEPYEYYHHLNELLEVSDNELLRPLYNLISELDESKHKFGWIGDYERFLYTQMIPHIKTSLEVLDEQNTQTILNFIDLFLQEYKKVVSYECSKTAKIKLKELFLDCHRSMQECALKFLMDKKEIDFIVLGMRKRSYVDEVLAF
jgi:aryl-alcohol dehydrogenase-like predicted oxidoreductase